ncbi:hypothetical protein GYA19_01580 [Candidatus Beckwithbacteria bacterium]|nr:hypothetical protein [Candidatus Beckwithbacteria bacterium]
MNKKIIFVCLIVLFSLLGFFFLKKEKNPQDFILGTKIKKGTFYIQGDNQVGVDSKLNLNFVVDTRNQAVNSVGFYLNFDPQKLEITNIDTSKSFCQFYPENKFDNQKGTIRISCGTPSPGFTGKNNFAQITFIAKSLGKTEIKIDPKSMILLNNGKGTNIFEAEITYPILILNKI